MSTSSDEVTRCLEALKETGEFLKKTCQALIRTGEEMEIHWEESQERIRELEDMDVAGLVGASEKFYEACYEAQLPEEEGIEAIRILGSFPQLPLDNLRVLKRLLLLAERRNQTPDEILDALVG